MSSIEIISGTQTRFLGIPPRLQIRIEDNRTGSYPVIRRTGDHDRMGFMSSTFNDANTIVFTGSSNVLYPQLLPRNSQMIQGLTGTIETVSSMSAGTSFVSNLISQSIIPGGAAPETITPFVDSRIYLSESAFYLTGTSPDQMLGFSSPLKDKTQIRIDITHNAPTAHYSTRFSRHSDGAGGDKFVTASSEFAGRDITGFSYYNWDLKRWEDTGHIDPASQTSLQYDWSVDASHITQAGLGTPAARLNIHSGVARFPQQFVPHEAYALQDLTSITSTIAQNSNLARSGFPTITHMAPADTRYHATSSQCLKMSDYISSPFALEKLVVNLPIMAQRQINGSGSTAESYSRRLRSPENKVPQQDYVFFIYRQQKKPFARGKYSGNNDHGPNTHASGTAVTASFGGRDSHYGVSGSQRFLICSGVMTFYNKSVQTKGAHASGDDTTRILNFSPLNGPSFKYGFNVDPVAGPYDSAGGDPITHPLSPATFKSSGTFTGSVMIEMQPAVVSTQFLGHSYVATSRGGYTIGGNDAGTGVSHYNARILHFWPGGTTFKPFRIGNIASGTIVGGHDTDSITFFGGHTFDAYPDLKEQADPRIPLENFSGSQISKLDPRPFRGPGLWTQTDRFIPEVSVETSIPSTEVRIATYQSGNIQMKTPYLLFPEDELIFGLEACIGLAPLQDFHTVTGSRMNICTPQLHNNIREVNGGRASITMFGSLVKEGKEYHETLNQNLTSNAIHEAIIGSPVVDQYDIASRDEMIGTYVDNYVVGNMHATGTTVGTQGIYQEGGTLVREQLDFTRTVMGSFASGTANPKGSSGTKSYYGSGSIQRFVRLSSRNERYYDTFLPDVYEYLVTNHGAGKPRIIGAQALGFNIADGNLIVVTGSVAIGANGNRMKLPFDNNMERYPESWGAIFNSVTPKGEIIIATGRRLIGIMLVIDTPNNPGSEHGLFLNDKIAKRILFETGKGTVETDIIAVGGVEGTEGIVDSYSGISGSARGFAYGIQNIDPAYTSAVYRWNRYGQFRDMLEQRQDGKFYVMEIAAEDEESEQSPGLQSAVVTVNFVKGSSIEPVIPGDTQCSNLSFECTSSVPYYDGMFRNRSEEMDVEEEFIALV